MERKLLLLGMLRMDTMHGYQINEVIDAHLGTSIQLKKPTVYKLLKGMVDEGWISYTEEQEGNYPTRRVYATTPQGEAAFQQLLRESLSEYKPVSFLSHIGLAFLDTLPPHEAIVLLQERRAIIEALLEKLDTSDDHEGGFQLLMLHQQRHLTAELEWFDEVIANLIPA